MLVKRAPGGHLTGTGIFHKGSLAFTKHRILNHNYFELPQIRVNILKEFPNESSNQHYLLHSDVIIAWETEGKVCCIPDSTADSGVRNKA